MQSDSPFGGVFGYEHEAVRVSVLAVFLGQPETIRLHFAHEASPYETDDPAAVCAERKPFLCKVQSDVFGCEADDPVAVCA